MGGGGYTLSMIVLELLNEKVHILKKKGVGWGGGVGELFQVLERSELAIVGVRVRRA